MKRFFDSLFNDSTVAPLSASGWQRRGTGWLGAALVVGLNLGMQSAVAQPGSVMQIPVPAPQARGAAVGGESVDVAQSAVPKDPLGDVVTGEPLAMPGETVPVGNWGGRSGVKEIALAEMPWMGGAGYGYGVAVAAQFQVVVATPSDAYVEALKQVMPKAIALADGQIMQAGEFADWRQANALQRALGVYGFFAEVQGL